MDFAPQGGKLTPTQNARSTQKVLTWLNLSEGLDE